MLNVKISGKSFKIVTKRKIKEKLCSLVQRDKLPLLLSRLSFKKTIFDVKGKSEKFPN